MQKLAIKKFKIKEMELIVVKNAALPLLLSIGGNYNLFTKKKIVKLKLLIMKNNFRQIDHKQFLLFFLG